MDHVSGDESKGYESARAVFLIPRRVVADDEEEKERTYG